MTPVWVSVVEESGFLGWFIVKIEESTIIRVDKDLVGTGGWSFEGTLEHHGQVVVVIVLSLGSEEVHNSVVVKSAVSTLELGGGPFVLWLDVVEVVLG